MSLKKAHESKKQEDPLPLYPMFQFERIIMIIFLLILISRDGVENLIAKATHLFSVRNMMLGYASQDLSIVLNDSMICKHLLHIHQ